MLNQVIPPYEGTQPFLYACYCAEDEALAFPILARMYNEGFRLFSALACRQDRNSTRGDSDFRSVQRLNASSSVILFMSHNMLERIRRSDPEVITAVKSPCLRTIIRLDDSEPSGDIYALSVPDHVEYSHGNDAPFWLYIYSNDSLEKCRGPWPEESRRLRLTESSYDDVTDEVISEEYQNLENILSGKSVQKQQPDEQPRYRDNSGYIMPTPDEYVYIPLDKTGDERFDELLDMLNAGEKHANDVITSQQNRLLAPPPPPPAAEPYPEPDWNAVIPAEPPEPEAEKEVEPIIEPLPEVQPVEPVQAVTEPKVEPAVQTEPEVEPVQAVPEAAPVKVAEPEPAPPVVEEKPAEPEPVKQPEVPSSVPVMVKSSSKSIKKKRTKVTAVKRSGTAHHLTASPDASALIENNMRERAYLQNYARRLVMEAMAETVPLMTAEALAAASATAAEEAVPESPRKHSRKPAAPVLETAPTPVPAAEAAPEPAVTETSSEEKPRARKNRHPHDHKGFNIFAAIRAAREERQNRKDHAEEQPADTSLESDADDELLLEETSGESSTPVLEAAVSKFVRKAAGRR